MSARRPAVRPAVDGPRGFGERGDGAHGRRKLSSYPVELRILEQVEGTFDGLYGLEILSGNDEEVSAQVTVRPELKQPAGLLHGGVLASMAESMASVATFMGVQADGKAAMGLSNATSFL